MAVRKNKATAVFFVLQNYSGTQASTNKIKMAPFNRGDGESIGEPMSGCRSAAVCNKYGVLA
jgi:hypothetical protein